MQINLAACRECCTAKEAKISECEATIAAKLAEIEAANAKIRNDETVRRKLHNTILELKVRFCTLMPVCIRFGKAFVLPRRLNQVHLFVCLFLCNSKTCGHIKCLCVNDSLWS